MTLMCDLGVILGGGIAFLSLLGVKWFSLGTGCHVWILHLRHSCQLLHQELHMEKVIEPLYHPLFKETVHKDN